MQVEHSIIIAAPPERVWQVTTDVERWPQWTPTVTSVRKLGDGAFGLGSVARIKQPGQAEAEWTVTAFEPNRRFAWATERSGMRMVGIHELQADGGGTRNVLRVEASGILAVLLWPVLRFAMQKALRDENAGLKRFCEQ
jgi:uncharacterized protein YndB with AHSA1/START domain